MRQSFIAMIFGGIREDCAFVNNREYGFGGMSINAEAPRLHAVGHRIRRLRQAKGLSRVDLAHKIGVDVSSIAGWESGKRLPRETIRLSLARTLECDLPTLLSPEEEPSLTASVSLLNVATEFPHAFAECARNARHIMRAVRFSSPYCTTVHVQTEARRIITERLLAGTLEVQRVEIFYSLDRLKEMLSNILRYDAKPYYAKAYCVGLTDVAPFLGGYSFDDNEIFLGGYWTGIPPQGHPIVRISGSAIRIFFRAYWSEIWGRGTLLNAHGAHDLSVVKDVAVKMGLPPRRWKNFVEEATTLEIGDLAPPLV